MLRSKDLGCSSANKKPGTLVWLLLLPNVFLRSCQHTACLDHTIHTKKTIKNFLSNIYVCMFKIRRFSGTLIILFLKLLTRCFESSSEVRV